MKWELWSWSPRPARHLQIPRAAAYISPGGLNLRNGSGSLARQSVARVLEQVAQSSWSVLRKDLNFLKAPTEDIVNFAIWHELH